MPSGRPPAPPAPPEQVERIKKAQELLALSQNALSRLIGCSQPTVSGWFTGNFPKKRADQIEAALAEYTHENLVATQTTHQTVVGLLKPVDWEGTPKGMQPNGVQTQGNKGEGDK